MFLKPKESVRGREAIFYYLMESGLYDPYTVRKFKEGEDHVSYVIDSENEYEELHVMAFIVDDELTEVGVYIFPNLQGIYSNNSFYIVYSIFIAVTILTLLSPRLSLLSQYLKI